MKTHGLKHDPWYATAYNQQYRMTNPKHPYYKNYGGRVLTFGEGMETIEKRILFYREFFGPEKPEGYVVDRIDNDRGYAKDNVRLVTRDENNRNKRNYHGMASTGNQTPTYISWNNMVNNAKRRGYLVNEYWKDFKNFLSDMGEKPAGKRLKRINKSLPYSKTNCTWS